MDKQKILKKYYHYMKPQKCVFKKCNFKYLITGKLRLTTTFRHCRCIFLAPHPMCVLLLFPLKFKYSRQLKGGRGWGLGWSDLCLFWANKVLTCKGFLQITWKDHISKLLALKVKVAGKGQKPNFKGHEFFKNQKMRIKQWKFANL